MNMMEYSLGLGIESTFKEIFTDIHDVLLQNYKYKIYKQQLYRRTSRYKIYKVFLQSDTHYTLYTIIYFL